MLSIFSRNLLPVTIALTLLAGCSRQKTSGVFIDPAFGPLVPPDTKYLAGIRLDKIRETPLYKRLNGRYNLEQQLNLFSERTGLDPNKNLWQVLVTSNGSDTLFLARGRFTTGELEPKLGSLGNDRTRYKDYTLIGRPDTSIVFVNPGVAAAGKQGVLRRLIDNRGAGTGVPEVLAKKLAAIPAADQIWAVSSAGIPSGPLAGADTTGMKSMFSNLLGFVDGAQVGIHLDSGAQLQALADCVSEEGAQRVRDAVKGAVGFARLNTPDNRMQLLKVFDTVNVEKKDTHVTIAAQVTPELVDPLLQMLDGRRR